MVFRVPKIQTCCCCMTLRTGSIITAVLQVLVFSFALVMSATHTNHPPSYNQILYYFTVFLNVGVFSFVLIYGLFKKNRVLMFPWILQQTVFLLFLLNYLFGSMVYLGLMNERPEEMVAEFLGVVIVGYTLLVVYNHYRELKEPQTEETN